MSEPAITLSAEERQALRALRDCGVIRVTTLEAARVFWMLFAEGLAHEAIVDANDADYRITDAGRAWCAAHMGEMN